MRSGSMPSSPACARTQRRPWRTSSRGAGKRLAGARRYEIETVAMPSLAKWSALPAAWLGSPRIQPPPCTKTTAGVGARRPHRPVVVEAQRDPAGLRVHHVGAELVDVRAQGNAGNLAREGHERMA